MKEIIISDVVYETLKETHPKLPDFDSKIRKLLLTERGKSD